MFARAAYPRLLAAAAIAVAVAVSASAGERPVPCAACVVIAIAPDESDPADTAGLPAAIVIPANADDRRIAGAVTVASRLQDPAIVLDARDAVVLTDETRYRLRSLATSVRARAIAPIGLELLSIQARDAALAALAGYIDFIVLPADADAAAAAARLPGVAVWTDAPPADALSALDLVTTARLPGSDRLLVRLAPGRGDVRSAIAAMREAVPRGLTPLPGVRVSCDAACEADVYLNPQTLDAIAIVRPRGLVGTVTVSPAATALTAFPGAQARSVGRTQLDLPPTGETLALQIHGWRDGADEAFATGVEVSGARRLSVEEVVARHQAARARSERAVLTLISTGSTVLSFRAPGFPAPVTVTARTTVFAGPGQTDVEQQDIRLNGLDVRRRAGDVPKLPLIEPERVGTPPLTIALTDAYSYELDGQTRVNGREAYIVSFAPHGSQRPSFAGRAWIDAERFVLVRIDATEMALAGPIASSREIDDYEVADENGVAVSFLRRAEIFQTYVGPVESTPIHRVVTFDRHEANAPDYASRLESAHRSDAVVLRDTPQGYRFLLPRPGISNGDTRSLAPSNRDRVATAVVGSLFDPNISVPLVFAGVSYVDFNLFGTGTQMNAFFGGTYGRLSWATRPFIAKRWRLSGDASAVAVSYNDRAIRGGVEHYDENIRQRPAQLSLALVGPIASSLRLRAGYDLGYTRYTRADSTATAFALPASTPVHAARIAVEAEHGAWTATGWAAAARRQEWTPWGATPSAAQRDARVFERFGASLARSMVWSPRAVGHVEAAWMSGRGLDRFNEFAFGTFENPLRGYPAVSIRYASGAALRSVATWTPARRVRVDGFADLGIVRSGERAGVRAYPGFGGAVEVPAFLGWLVAAEWGYGIRGVNSAGGIGTHVIRVTGYKLF